MTDIPNVESGVLDGIREQARSAEDRPVGGILLGWVEGDALSVERAVPAADPDVHGGELVFTPSSWDAAYAAIESAGPESRIVGWYHAHPSHGAVLSDYDRSLHRTVFSDPSQVALVVDPKTEEVAWFGWQVERIAPLAQDQAEAASAVGAIEGVPAVAAVAAGRPRRRLIGALVAAAILVGAVVGAYLLGHSGTTAKVITRTAPASTAKLQQARAQAEQLEAQLAAESARAAAVQAQLEATREKLRKTTDLLKSSSGNPPKKPQTVAFLYQVRPGDSMAGLAQLFYGSWTKWAKIWHANPSPDPNRIVIGSWLKIPLQAA
jgi:proteasome lid subunit RPN8/RPN11